ncbi:MAG TPA: hypothetical protein VH120_10260 [Gemmataceae bacterium]|jgi:hypothetical protein|nr:hypothetical protein [Gemmataceae bacterium]
MTRYAGLAAVLAATLSGCLPEHFVAPSADKSAAKPLEPGRPIVRPPVTAGQINATNAQEKAQALRGELDREMEQAIEANDAKPEKK